MLKAGYRFNFRVVRQVNACALQVAIFILALEFKRCRAAFDYQGIDDPVPRLSLHMRSDPLHLGMRELLVLL